jgi:hypothetical protein
MSAAVAVGVTQVEAARDRLLALLPVHHRARDQGPGGAPGPLSELVGAIAGELALLEQDLERLHDGWFVETCDEWLVPYLADLVGLAEVPPDLGVAVSRRALVANTVAYRRRKGTVAVLEQVARDVTGWPSRAVEHHPLLVAAAHVNHVRTDRAGVASVRDAATLELGAVVSPPAARGALDPLRHTAEVRSIARRRGRYGIRNVAVFPFPVQTYAVGAAPVASGPAPTGADGGWSRARAVGGWLHFDPLGRAVPLFAVPRAEEAIERLATEPDLPLPLRPRRLLALLQAARRGELDAAELPLGVRLEADGTDLPPDRIRVCRLEPLAPGDEPQVMVDALAGRLRAYREQAPHAPGDAFVRYAYGAMADVGAGTYDRADVHDSVLQTDLWTRPGPDEDPGTDLQLAVSSNPSGDEVADVATALGDAQDAWADPAQSADRASFTVSVGDSAHYPGALSIEVPAATRLVLVAAGWPTRVLPNGEVLTPVPGRYVPDGLRPHVQGTLTVTGGPGSSVVLDGLLLEGDVVVGPGDLGSLTVAQCTVTGTVRAEAGAGGANGSLQVRLVRSIVGAVALAGTVPMVVVTDSVLDAVTVDPPPPGDLVLAGAGAHASLEGATVRGDVAVRTLDASSCVLDGTVTSEHRQVGCVRFSYVGPGSRTPRRHRCVPATLAQTTPTPVYVSTDPAAPAYPALDAACSPLIAAGGEGESEMGVHHHLRRPLRVGAAGRQLDPYLPVGSQLGLFGGGRAR